MTAVVATAMLRGNPHLAYITANRAIQNNYRYTMDIIVKDAEGNEILSTELEDKELAEAPGKLAAAGKRANNHVEAWWGREFEETAYGLGTTPERLSSGLSEAYGLAYGVPVWTESMRAASAELGMAGMNLTYQERMGIRQAAMEAPDISLGQVLDVPVSFIRRIVTRPFPETELEVVVAAATLPFATGGKIGGAAARSAGVVEQSPWSYGPVIRGEIIEQKLGHNLPRTFPTIDKFDFATGKATSIKSIDLRGISYQDPKRLQSVVNRYVDKVADFARVERVELGGTRIKPSEVHIRELELAIPKGATSHQNQAIQQAAEYAQSQGVTINIVEIP